MSYDMSNYSAVNTDVWVFGTPQAYSEFAELVIKHEEPIHILAGEDGGMDLAMLPPALNVSSEFLVLHERLVYRDKRFNMELVVGGSVKGFQFLSDQFLHSMRQHTGDVDNHFHIDDTDEFLLMPSVFLNIHGPLDDLERHLPKLAPDAPTDLLPDMDWRDPKHWSYEPITDYDSLRGRFPLNKTKEEQGIAPNV